MEELIFSFVEEKDLEFRVDTQAKNIESYLIRKHIKGI